MYIIYKNGTIIILSMEVKNMKKRILTTIVCAGTILLLLGTTFAVSKAGPTIKNDVRLSQVTVEKNVRTIKNTLENGNQRQETVTIIAPKTNRRIAEVIPELVPTVPSIAWTQNTFGILLYYNQFKDTFTVSLNAFTYNEAQKTYSYTLSSPVIFETKDVPFASLNQLSIQFKLQIPYKISYTYEIQTYPLEDAPFGDFMYCHVSCSPMIVPDGLYKAKETFNAESGFESYTDYDGQVIKRALGYIEGDGTKSTAYFKVSSPEYAEEDYVYQRGMLYLSAIIGDGKTPSGGAMVSAYVQTLGFDILGAMNRFWLDSGWEGTIGDKYTSSVRFQIEPR
jgi:hypothetical protein